MFQAYLIHKASQSKMPFIFLTGKCIKTMIEESGLLGILIVPGLLPLSDGVLFCPFVSFILINNFVWDLTFTPIFFSLLCEIIFS